MARAGAVRVGELFPRPLLKRIAAQVLKRHESGELKKHGLVRDIGGLKNSIQEFSKKTGKGTGFKFKIPETKFFMQSLQKALSCFNQSETWQKLLQNGMAKDNSWQSSAKQYSRLYHKSLSS